MDTMYGYCPTSARRHVCVFDTVVEVVWFSLIVVDSVDSSDSVEEMDVSTVFDEVTVVEGVVSDEVTVVKGVVVGIIPPIPTIQLV